MLVVEPSCSRHMLTELTSIASLPLIDKDPTLILGRPSKANADETRDSP